MLFPQKNMIRKLELLDGIWKTEIDGVFRDMAVPASWNEQYSELFNYFGICRYMKEVFVSEIPRGKKLWLRFGGVTTNAEVYVNGILVGKHEGTALPFEFCINHAVKENQKNLIEVLVDNTLNPWGLPPATLLENEGRAGFTHNYPAVTYDFFPYGGIHRSVYLYEAPDNRIEGIKIDTDISGEISFTLSLSDLFEGTCLLTIDGKDFTFNIKNQKVITGNIRIVNPRLWNVGAPELYDLEIKLFDKNKLVDCYIQSIGFREVAVRDNKLFVNNEEVFLKGFGKHEDFAVLGKGFNSAIMVKDFTLLKWIGANSFRTSHYPYDEQILDYADQHGILVIDETPFVGLNERMYKNEILCKAKTVIGELMERDYNHPSVIIWSMANEPMVNSENGEWFFKEMYDCAKKYDTSRPITYVAHAEPEDNLGMKYYDFVCLNKYYGWYVGPGQIDDTLQDLSDCLDRFYRAFGKSVMLTEFGADAIPGIHTEPPQMFSEEYQCEIIRKQYELARGKEYMLGTHVWAFADFKTAQSISRVIVNRKGVFTRERDPKASAHMLREIWNREI